MPKYPVVYATKAQLKAHDINLDAYPSAGPNANVTGMRNKYWGKDALIVKHGQYIYKVPWAVYGALAPYVANAR